MLFRCDDSGTLTFVSKLDLPKQSIQRNISAMERFRNMDKRATTEDRNTALDTLHQNSITYVTATYSAALLIRVTLWDVNEKGNCNVLNVSRTSENRLCSARKREKCRSERNKLNGCAQSERNCGQSKIRFS